MSAPGDGEPTPPPPIYVEEAFFLLTALQGKKKTTPLDPKFIKKLESIPEIALPEEQPFKIALALAERGLVGQFMGLWSSTRSTNDWIQQNWRPLIQNSVTCYPVGIGFFIF
jgi:hypothetical protein